MKKTADYLVRFSAEEDEKLREMQAVKGLKNIQALIRLSLGFPPPQHGGRRAGAGKRKEQTACHS